MITHWSTGTAEDWEEGYLLREGSLVSGRIDDWGGGWRPPTGSTQDRY